MLQLCLQFRGCQSASKTLAPGSQLNQDELPVAMIVRPELSRGPIVFTAQTLDRTAQSLLRRLAINVMVMIDREMAFGTPVEIDRPIDCVTRF